MSTNQTQKTLSGQIRLRPATESDVPFIFNSWLRCNRHSTNTRGCENPVYFAQHHKLIEGLCKKAEIFIACNEQDVSQIYGYICYERVEGLLVVHWIYTKESFRKLGIAKMMADKAGFKADEAVLYTHRTFISEALEKKYIMVFNPYLAFYGYELGKS